MKAVESVIKLLRPAENMRAMVARRVYRPNPIFKRGEIVKATLATLRDTTRPLTADEICFVLYAAKGVVQPTKDHIRSLRGSVLTALAHYSGKVIAGDGGRPQRWSIIQPDAASGN
jgi:hypothetical protein